MLPLPLLLRVPGSVVSFWHWCWWDVVEIRQYLKTFAGWNMLLMLMVSLSSF